MKKKFYCTVDTETATLPFANEIALTPSQKQKIAIAKPLVYDLGWVITDRQGNIIKKENYLIQETFFVPSVFNTAYYKEKRPIYMEMLKNGEIKRATWEQAINHLILDMRECDMICAYNATFDFKKAIPFTERYINALYSEHYNEWEQEQRKKCEMIIKGADDSKNEDYLTPHFILRGIEYPLCDLWGVACDRLINIDKYKKYCLDNGLVTNSVQYFKTSAETSFQYLMNNHDFIESHTALDDAIIESQILTKALRKGKLEPTIESFPFRQLGTTFDYVLQKKNRKYAEMVIDLLEVYMETLNETTAYYSKMNNQLERLCCFFDLM